MMTVQLTMDYIGKSLSVNHYKFANRATKPETKLWMMVLHTNAKYHLDPKRCPPIKQPPTIHLHGVFKDKRSCPDLHNLHKVIGDALQNSAPGLGNDREFRFVDEGYELNRKRTPILVIGIEVEEDNVETYPHYTCVENCSCESTFEEGANAMFKALWKYIPVELQRCVFGKEEHGNDKDED